MLNHGIRRLLNLSSLPKIEDRLHNPGIACPSYAMRAFATLAALVTGISAAYADPLYRCVDPQQKVTYQSEPCPRSHQARMVTEPLRPENKTEIGLIRNFDRHFYATISINGVPIRGMIDTGASELALTPSAIQRTHLITMNARPGQHATANGVASTTLFSIPAVSFYDQVFYNVSSHTMHNDRDEALIGMNILKNFDINIEGDIMRLKPK